LLLTTGVIFLSFSSLPFPFTGGSTPMRPTPFSLFHPRLVPRLPPSFFFWSFLSISDRFPAGRAFLPPRHTFLFLSGRFFIRFFTRHFLPSKCEAPLFGKSQRFFLRPPPFSPDRFRCGRGSTLGPFARFFPLFFHALGKRCTFWNSVVFTGRLFFFFLYFLKLFFPPAKLFKFPLQKFLFLD